MNESSAADEQPQADDATKETLPQDGLSYRKSRHCGREWSHPRLDWNDDKNKYCCGDYPMYVKP